jgi:dCMP deaminase
MPGAIDSWANLYALSVCVERPVCICESCARKNEHPWEDHGQGICDICFVSKPIMGIGSYKDISIGRDADRDRVLMNMAFSVSRMSKDPRSKVGAIIISPDRRRISAGYNGFPPGFPDVRSWWDNRSDLSYFLKHDLVNHAEENAMSQAKCDLSGWTMYCTHMPCIRCARRIVTEGLSSVFYAIRANNQNSMEDPNRYRFEFVEKMFKIAGIRCEVLENVRE